MKSSIAIIIRWVFFGTSIIHGPAKGQVDHRIDQCPFELLVTFLLIQAERPARRGGRGGAKVWTFKKGAVFFGNHAPFSWVVGGGCSVTSRETWEAGAGAPFSWVVGGGCSVPTRHRPTTARARSTASTPPRRPRNRDAPAPPRTPTHQQAPTTHPPTTPNQPPTTHHPQPRAPHTTHLPPQAPHRGDRPLLQKNYCDDVV